VQLSPPLYKRKAERRENITATCFNVRVVDFSSATAGLSLQASILQSHRIAFAAALFLRQSERRRRSNITPYYLAPPTPPKNSWNSIRGHSISDALSMKLQASVDISSLNARALACTFKGSNYSFMFAVTPRICIYRHQKPYQFSFLPSSQRQSPCVSCLTNPPTPPHPTTTTTLFKRTRKVRVCGRASFARRETGERGG
jgi:hypothetical protein